MLQVEFWGVVTHDIADGSIGKVSVIGEVHDINTSTFSEGDVVYLGEVAGTLTATKPSGRCFVCRIGTIVDVATTTGSMLLSISSAQLASELNAPVGFPNNSKTFLDLKIGRAHV